MMTSDTSSELMRDQYLERIDTLFECLRRWLSSFDPSACVTEESTTIKEEPVESYEASVLAISRSGFKTVRVIPRGCWIVGAEGRVDLKSDLGTETLVYIADGGPVIRIETMTDGGKNLGHKDIPILGGEIAEGWVFLQNRQLGITPVLDELLFQRLLEVLGR